MVSRIPTPVRVILLLLLLLALLGPQSLSVAHAANRYTFTSRTEGDPGDGVLRPSVDGPGGTAGSGERHPTVADQAGAAPVTGTALPLSADYFIVPVFLPAGPGGPGAMIIVPRAWSRFLPLRMLQDGRWHHVP